MNFWWIFLIVIGILVFVFWLVIKSTQKKLNPNPTTKSQEGQGGQGAYKKTHDESHESSHGTKSSVWVKTKNTLIAIFVLLLILWVITEIFSGPKEMVSPREKHPSVSNVIKITDDTWIEFGPGYNKTYVLPRGIIFGFREASEPYCVLNDYSIEACARIGEDASDDLPRGSEGNLKLKFKSSNGKKCRLKIIIR